VTVAPPSAQRVAVPAYIHPARTADWDALLAQDPGRVPVLVANVADGPGTAADPAWQDLITRAGATGKRVLGYVDTGYLGTDGGFNELKGATWSAEQWAGRAAADARRWHGLYTGIGGVFFDTVAWACGPDDRWARLYAGLVAAYRRDHPGDLTVLNPGANPQVCLRDAADVIVSWEGPADRYLDGPWYGVWWDPPPSAERFWHIVHTTAPGQVEAVVARSRERGAGWVYVTERPGDWRRGENAYDGFPRPEVWDQVLAALAER
jgi:hypothetical protein